MKRRRLSASDKVFLAWVFVLILCALGILLLFWADANTVPLV